MLPLPIILVKHIDDSLNHPSVFINESFKKIIGWDLAEICDKDHWWKKAYPNKEYQKVVERQWELEVETAKEKSEGFVLTTVNVMTKYKGQMRFKVYTELDSMLMEGFYIVAFEKVPNETN